ncbi:MAG: carboxymuconolactone decarboxylase family protein [Chitinophagales bacterium]
MNETIFKVPTYEEVADGAKTVFDQFIKASGRMPNLYATIGYSANALSSYMAFVQAQAKGTFHGKDREAVYLIVSKFNGCEYCQASHTPSAIKFGWKEEETILLRAGKFPERKWQVIYRLIESVLEHKGEVSHQILQEFFSLGYNEAALMDMMALIMAMTFTNYVYRLTKIPIDFPLVKAV